MNYIEPLLLIAAGILAASALIIAKKPSAAELINKLSPYQATIGVVLLAWNLYWFFHIGPGLLFKSLGSLPGITLFAMIASGLVLGFMFGMPQIAKWIPGESNAEAKASQLAKKLAPFQILIGIVAIASGFLGLLYELRILKIGL